MSHSEAPFDLYPIHVQQFWMGGPLGIFYHELQSESLRGQLVFNPFIPLQEWQINALLNIGNVHTLVTDYSQIPGSSRELTNAQMISLKTKAQQINAAALPKGYYGNISTQRKWYLPHLSQALDLTMPFAPKSDNNFPISVKGTGSFTQELSETDLLSDEEITGLTAFGNDHEVTHVLTRDLHTVYDLSGKTITARYTPGRQLLMAAPIQYLRLANENIIDVSELQKPHTANHGRYPLLYGKNRPYALFYLEYSHLTYENIEYICQDGDDNDIFCFIDQMQADLCAHPYFHDLGHIERPTDFLAQFLLRQSKMNFINTQIQAKLHIVLEWRELQNRSIAGEQDFDESYQSETAQIDAPSLFKEEQIKLYSVFAGLMKRLNQGERQSVLTAFNQAIQQNGVVDQRADEFIRQAQLWFF